MYALITHYCKTSMELSASLTTANAFHYSMITYRLFTSSERNGYVIYVCIYISTGMTHITAYPALKTTSQLTRFPSSDTAHWLTKHLSHKLYGWWFLILCSESQHLQITVDVGMYMEKVEFQYHINMMCIYWAAVQLHLEMVHLSHVLYKPLCSVGERNN